MPNHLKTYIIKAAWRSTSKLLKVKASSPEEALEKAKKAKENKGCSVISLIREEDSPPTSSTQESS
jgi:hypothetical protein